MRITVLRRYVLDEDGNPVLEPDILRWSLFFGDITKREVAFDGIVRGKIIQRGDIAWDDPGFVGVSTVFLGLDHSFGGNDRDQPVLWETLVQGGYLADEMCRYTSRKEAVAGHQALAQTVLLTMSMEAMFSFGEDYLTVPAEQSLLRFEGLRAFEAWARDHLRTRPAFFGSRRLGFRRAQDAAIFMLSEWFVHIDNITDPSLTPLSDAGDT